MLRFFAFLPESYEFNAFSGRSSDLSRFHKAFPFNIVEQWQVFHETIIVRTIGHHSSGYCCGFKPHSLFTARILESLQYQNLTKIINFSGLSEENIRRYQQRRMPVSDCTA